MSRYFYPAHNGYLEIILVLGFVGLLIMSLFLISSARKARPADPRLRLGRPLDLLARHGAGQ